MKGGVNRVFRRTVANRLVSFYPDKRKIEQPLIPKEVCLLNYFRGSVWFVVLILVIIAVAFILSILPQEIRWILFIISIACIVIQSEPMAKINLAFKSSIMPMILK